MVQWLGAGGERDPVAFGASMRQAKAAEPAKFPCPEPLYLLDKSIQRVAQWCNCPLRDAQKMYEDEPALFNRYLGWAEVESEAEAVAYAYADTKAKRKADAAKSAPLSLGSVK